MALGISVVALVVAGVAYSQSMIDTDEQIQTTVEEATAELEAELEEVRDQLNATDSPEEPATTTDTTE